MYYTTVHIPLVLELRVCKVPFTNNKLLTRDTGATHRYIGTQLRSHSRSAETENNSKQERKQNKQKKENEMSERRRKHRKQNERRRKGDGGG